MVKQVIASAQITLTDLGDAIISGTKPTNPKLDQLWIERLTGKPDKLWRWNGTSWIEQTLDLSALDPDADGKIENHETTIGNMVDDAKLDVTERQEVKNKLSPLIGQAVLDSDASIPSAFQLWQNGVGEVWAVRKAAQNVGITNADPAYLAVETTYNALQAYLNGMTPIKPWDASAANKDKIITVVPTDWRNKWVDYYKAVQSLTIAVQTKLQGNIDAIDVSSRNLLNGTATPTTAIGENRTNQTWTPYFFAAGNSKTINDASTFCMSFDWVIEGTAAGTLNVQGNNPYPALATTVTFSASNNKGRVSGVRSIPNGTGTFTGVNFRLDNFPVGSKITISNVKIETGNKPTGWTPSPEDVAKAIEDADKKAQLVTESVNDMSLDSKLTPVEKIQLKTDYDSITAEFTTTLNSADAFNLTSSSERAAYNTAYNALKTFVDPLLVKMNETSGVDRAAFRQRFKDYYDTKAKLLKKISDTSKGLIDDSAKQTPNIILNSGFLQGTKFWDNLPTGVSLDTSIDLGGIPVIKVIQSGNQDNIYRGANTQLYPAPFDSNITFSIYSFAPNLANIDSGLVVEIKTYDKDKNRITPSTWAVECTPSKSGVWERFSRTISISGNKDIKYINFFFYVRKNGTAYFAKPMLQIGNALGNWSPNPADVFADTIDTKAEESKNAIADMSSDNKLTPLEKVQLKKEWGTIAAEKPQFEALGKSYYNASSELNAYINAYNTLNNTLNGTTGYLKNMASTDTINGATFRSQFDTYYAKQAELIKKVNNLIQGNIDGIQGVKNLILASKRAINSNDYLLNDFTITEDFVAGQDYTFVVKGTVTAGQKFGIWQNGGATNVGYAEVEFIKDVYYVSFKAVATTAGNARSLRLYNFPSNTTNATVEWVALYKGTKPFDWTAAPEDADVGKTNLVIDSEFKYLASWIQPNPSFFKTETGIMPNGVKNVTLSINSTDGTNKYADFAQFIEVEPNTEYTFSCKAGGTFQTFLWEKKADKTPTNVYKDNAKSHGGASWDMSSPRDTFTRTIKTQPDTKYIHFIFRVQSNTTTYVSGRLALPQLEKGTTASEWKPNPFDTSNGEIFIQGSATDITDGNRKLTVNGNVIYNSNAGRGLRLVTLKKDTLAVVDDITYDVYGSDVPKNDLATKINSLGNDVFITLTSYDAVNFNTNLLTALVSVGASGTILQGRLPYAFIGMKGLGRYNGLEQWTGLGNMFPPATISCKVVNGMIQGINNNNGQSDANVRKDLRLNAPLPTSILMDSNGITASGTDASKYARLDYRGLYIAGGAIQIDGGLSEGQLAQGVTRKMSYLDSNGLYTGQVNIGGSGQNGILSIKNSSNSEIVRGDTNGLTVNNGAITIKRPDGANLIINGMAAYNFAVTTHNPPFRGDNIDTRSWYYHTTKGIPFNRDLQVCDYVATQHTGRYMKMDVDFYTSPSNSGALVVIQAGKYNSGGQEVIVSQIEITNTTPQTNYTLSIDCGVPTYQRIGFYFCLASWSAGDVYARLVRAWMEG
ncbi:minor structural protein [Bacillus phage BCPST]|uniref:Minor structural protein n=1 Tax=Bacillus phage BCPST TaxID=2801506 RepID=A0AAE7P3K0_9CAUD|nr:minor structural protein [Bacillus phage BCPST]QQO38687.1 minor structural protein [Bacillus phage BCPST]QSJ04279.1 tail fiber protein [Bacillus phage BCP6]